jgi:hypothetical protein
MSDRLDQMLSGLAGAAPDHSLEGLEGAVWAGIGRERAAARARMAMVPVSCAAVLMATAVGVATGRVAAGEAAKPPQGELLAFSVPLAPSTLLEGS